MLKLTHEIFYVSQYLILIHVYLLAFYLLPSFVVVELIITIKNMKIISCYQCKFESYSFDDSTKWNYLFALPCKDGYLCLECFEKLKDDDEDEVYCSNCFKIHNIPLTLYKTDDYMIPKLKRQRAFNNYLLRYPNMSDSIKKNFHSMQLRSETNNTDFAIKYNEARKTRFINKIKRKGFLLVKK